jgi:RND family efflux transporter MFP subunit
MRSFERQAQNDFSVYGDNLMHMISRRFSFLAAALLVLGAGLLSGCSDGQASSAADTSQAPERPPARVETLRLTPTSFEDVIELTGTVEALNDATLSAQAAGTVTVLAERGARIPAGGRVAQVDAREEEAAVEQAEARYALAQDRFERQEPLYKDSIISALEFEQVRSERNQARAALAQAEKRLANTRVESPFAGIIEERFVERGEQIRANDPVARVVSTREVRVVAGVPERYANDIRPGTAVRLDFRKYGGTERTAEVTFAGRAINPDTRTFPIEVTLDNPDGRLKPEMVARVSVTRARLDSVVVIPRTAVVRDEAGTHAYVAVPTDSTVTAQKRDIVLGPRYAERTVVESGLSMGASVIVAGQNALAPGDPVRIATQYDRIDASGTPYGAASAASRDAQPMPTPAE